LRQSFFHIVESHHFWKSVRRNEQPTIKHVRGGIAESSMAFSEKTTQQMMQNLLVFLRFRELNCVRVGE
jgi:hypothetical protein